MLGGCRVELNNIRDGKVGRDEPGGAENREPMPTIFSGAAENQKGENEQAEYRQILFADRLSPRLHVLIMRRLRHDGPLHVEIRWPNH